MLSVTPTQMMTRVGLGAIEKWRSSYPSSDDDTCRAGRYLLSQPSAGLDASHASKSITAWREKKPSYKGKLNRICRGTFFITTNLLGLCAFVRSYRAYFLWVFGCSCHWLERRSATDRRGATLCFQVLWRSFCGVDLKGTWSQAGEEVRDEATLWR